MIYEIFIEIPCEKPDDFRDKLSHLADAKMTRWAHLHTNRTHFVTDAMLAVNNQVEEFGLGLV